MLQTLKQYNHNINMGSRHVLIQCTLGRSANSFCEKNAFSREPGVAAAGAPAAPGSGRAVARAARPAPRDASVADALPSVIIC